MAFVLDDPCALHKVVGILVLTLAGLIGLVAIYGAYMESAVPVTLAGDGRVSVSSWDNGYVSVRLDMEGDPKETGCCRR